MASAERIDLANMSSVETFLLLKRHEAENAMLRKLAMEAMALAKEAVLANPSLTKHYELAHMRAIALGVLQK